MSSKVLIIEDEQNIQELLSFNISNAGYDVRVSDNGNDGLAKAFSESPDLIILDLMLPDMDGFEVCKRLKSDVKTKMIPIIILTAKSEELDKILGLELGADDYITKPFSIRELLARIKVVLRRGKVEDDEKVNNEESIIKIGDMEIDCEKFTVTKNGNPLDLTLKEFELLKLLVLNKDKVLTRDFLLDKVWGYEYSGETRTVDVHIRHLRRKIEKDDNYPQYIETVRGVGYKFNGKGAQ